MRAQKRGVQSEEPESSAGRSGPIAGSGRIESFSQGKNRIKGILAETAVYSNESLWVPDHKHFGMTLGAV